MVLRSPIHSHFHNGPRREGNRSAWCRGWRPDSTDHSAYRRLWPPRWRLPQLPAPCIRQIHTKVRVRKRGRRGEKKVNQLPPGLFQWRGKSTELAVTLEKKKKGACVGYKQFFFYHCPCSHSCIQLTNVMCSVGPLSMSETDSMRITWKTAGQAKLEGGWLQINWLKAKGFIPGSCSRNAFLLQSRWKMRWWNTAP